MTSKDYTISQSSFPKSDISETLHIDITENIYPIFDISPKTRANKSCFTVSFAFRYVDQIHFLPRNLAKEIGYIH